MFNMNDVDQLIDECNKVINLEYIVNDNYSGNSTYSDQLEVISFTKVGPSTSISEDVTNKLGVKAGDEILFILDNNGIINVKKFIGYPILGDDEIFISSSRIGHVGKSTIVSISKDLLRILKDRYILWILDEKDNIIIRNSILSDCINKFNSVLSMSIHDTPNRIFVPLNVRDILMVDYGSIIAFILKNDEIIVKNIEDVTDTANLLYVNKINVLGSFYIKEDVIDMANITNKILWLLDDFGNVVLRNNFLPNACKK